MAIDAVHRAYRVLGRIVVKTLVLINGGFPRGRSVTRTQGMTCRWASVAMYSTFSSRLTCQWMPLGGPFSPPPPTFSSSRTAKGVLVSSREIVIIGAVDVADEAFRPVAFFAGVARRAQVFNRGRDGRGIWLVTTSKSWCMPLILLFTYDSMPDADMAFNTGDARVGRVQIGGVFRVHGHVARHAAKLDGVGILVGLVTAERRRQQKHHVRPGQSRRAFSGRARAIRSICSRSETSLLPLRPDAEQGSETSRRKSRWAQ